MKPWMIAVVVVAVLAVGGGAFYGGMKFRENQLIKDPQQLFQQMAGQRNGQTGTARTGADGQPGGFVFGQGRQGSTGQGANGTMGTIASIEGGIVTVTTSDGASVKVQTSDTTLVQKSMSVTVAELTVGENIIVSGTKNDDGSVTARSIQSVQGLPGATPAPSGTN